MDLSEILSIGGKPGLYKMVSQTKNGLIVESIGKDKKRMPVYASDKVSALDEISIFTKEEDIPLKEVFKKIFVKQEGKQAIAHKSSKNDLRSFFLEVLPEYDEEKVYDSDIKKVIQWYNVLQKEKLIDIKEKKEKKTDETKKTTAKKPAAKKPAARKPVAKKPVVKKASSKQPAVKRPAAKKI
jgi:Domain of unknown function (DUF6852)/Domain of unknown function (DUF5606)